MVADYFFPRNPETVREQIEGTKELVKETLRLLNKFPGDVSLKFSLEQYVFLLKELALEWKIAKAFQKAIEEQKLITYHVSANFNLLEVADLLEKIDSLFESKKALDCYTAGSVKCQEDFVLTEITCIEEEREFCRLQVEVKKNSIAVRSVINCSVNCISEFLDRFFSNTVGREKIRKVEVDGSVLWKREE